MRWHQQYILDINIVYKKNYIYPDLHIESWTRPMRATSLMGTTWQRFSEAIAMFYGGRDGAEELRGWWLIAAAGLLDQNKYTATGMEINGLLMKRPFPETADMRSGWMERERWRTDWSSRIKAYRTMKLHKRNNCNDYISFQLKRRVASIDVLQKVPIPLPFPPSSLENIR